MVMRELQMPELLTPAEVAQMFRVDPNTVTRWARSGHIASVRTIGGHRRYFKREVEALLRHDAPGSSTTQEGRQVFTEL